MTEPPGSTIAALSSSRVDAHTKYTIGFVPYGTARGVTGQANSVVVRILSSQPVGKVDKPFDFTEHNMLVDITALPTGQSLDRGGRYSGTLAFVVQGKSVVPQLVSIKSVK